MFTVLIDFWLLCWACAEPSGLNSCQTAGRVKSVGWVISTLRKIDLKWPKVTWGQTNWSQLMALSHWPEVKFQPHNNWHVVAHRPTTSNNTTTSGLELDRLWLGPQPQSVQPAYGINSENSLYQVGPANCSNQLLEPFVNLTKDPEISWNIFYCALFLCLIVNNYNKTK